LARGRSFPSPPVTEIQSSRLSTITLHHMKAGPPPPRALPSFDPTQPDGKTRNRPLLEISTAALF
jgi:hypothetical protein